MPRILLAGTANPQVATVEGLLRQAGHDVDRAATRAEVLESLNRGTTQLAVLVGRLADGTFGECVRAVRNAPGLALAPLVVVGDSDDAIDRIVSLELGADDFVGRDTSPREFLLRLGALLRRIQPTPPQLASRERYGRLEMDRGEYRVWVDGEETAVSPAEFRLLVALASPAGAVHRRKTLEAALIGDERVAGARWLDARISRLRTRLHGAGAQVETVRGVGFRLASPGA